MAALAALLWDVDGTIAESERDGHRVAFNLAFEALGVPWRWDDAHYGYLLRVTGGRERLLYDMAERADAPRSAAEREALAANLHWKKNALYADLVRSGCVPLRPGVAALMNECVQRGVRLGIATTTSRANLEALLASTDALPRQEQFSVIVCGEDVTRKKPHPEAFVHALALLALTADQAVAIEDSPGGVTAARAAGLATLVTPSSYFADATFDGALAIGPGLHQRAGWQPALPDASGRVTLEDIDHWRRACAGK
jgi:HAD superfamily hydrolase (TIGR01509 family)